MEKGARGGEERKETSSNPTLASGRRGGSAKSSDLSSGEDSSRYAPRYAPRARASRGQSARACERAGGRWRSGDTDRCDQREPERRRRRIFAIPIPSSTSSLNLHLRSLPPPRQTARSSEDADVSRVTLLAAECSMMDKRTYRRIQETDSCSRYKVFRDFARDRREPRRAKRSRGNN